MAHPDPSPYTASIVGIAEPHRSAVTAVLRAAHEGVFSADEANRVIERIRARTAPPEESIQDSPGGSGPSR
jgi:hypothetical protein